jgi:hypothetical protein
MPEQACTLPDTNSILSQSAVLLSTVETIVGARNQHCVVGLSGINLNAQLVRTVREGLASHADFEALGLAGTCRGRGCVHSQSLPCGYGPE